jgi:hypothetical protein
MRFPIVVAVVAALTASISAMPTVADTSVSAGDGATCPRFCTKSYQCCGFCVSGLRPGFNRMTHRRDSFSLYAMFSVYVVSGWLMARRVEPRSEAQPLGEI